jgi:hypothetical protein
VQAQPAHGLASNTLNAGQFVYRTKGMRMAISQDIAHASGANARQEAQLVHASRVEVDHTFELRSVGIRSRFEERQHDNCHAG